MHLKNLLITALFLNSNAAISEDFEDVYLSCNVKITGTFVDYDREIEIDQLVKNYRVVISKKRETGNVSFSLGTLEEYPYHFLIAGGGQDWWLNTRILGASHMSRCKYQEASTPDKWIVNAYNCPGAHQRYLTIDRRLGTLDFREIIHHFPEKNKYLKQNIKINGECQKIDTSKLRF